MVEIHKKVVHQSSLSQNVYISHKVSVLRTFRYTVFVKDCIPEEGPQGLKLCVRYESFVPVKTDGTTFCEFPLLHPNSIIL